MKNSNSGRQDFPSDELVGQALKVLMDYRPDLHQKAQEHETEFHCLNCAEFRALYHQIGMLLFSHSLVELPRELALLEYGVRRKIRSLLNLSLPSAGSL